MADTKLKCDLEAILRGVVDAANRGVINRKDCTLKSHSVNHSALDGIDYIQVLSDNKVYSTLTVNCMDNTGKSVGRFRVVILWRKEDGTWMIERKFVNLKELPPQDQAQADIKAQIAVLYDAFNRKDMDTILKLYVDEPTWLHHGQEDIKGKEAGRESIRQLFPTLKTLVLDEVFSFEMFGDDVAHTNAYTNCTDENGKAFYRIRDDFLWKKVDGRWLVQIDAFNEVPLV